MKLFSWLVRLPRHGRRLAALNRNGVDIERRPRRRLKAAVALNAVIEAMREAARALDQAFQWPRLPLLLRQSRRPYGTEWPHIPTGSILKKAL